MMTKIPIWRLAAILFASFSMALIGCSGGSSSNSSSSVPTPALNVVPASYDFGIITGDNTAAPLDVTLRNDGSANLVVSNMDLSDTVNFDLDVNGGADPCQSTSPTLGVGGSCTVTVSFLPESFGSFTTNLAITSNDSRNLTFNLGLTGSKQDITRANVKINQIEACPRPVPPATIYVSVTDQAGFPITTLAASDFSILEDGSPKPVTSAAAIDDTITLSVVLLLDYSGSITAKPDNVTDMENAAIGFVNQLGINDEAEIIKYATTVEVTQPFTSNKDLLINKIQTAPNVGINTALYDALIQAVSDISVSTKDRRAIIVMTDGKDDDGTGNPKSTSTLTDVIMDANGDGVPVFTVGLGNIEVAILQQLAADTGGTFSPSTTSDNLITIYQQLADLLFTDQYILTYTSALASNAIGNLAITATYAPGIAGTDTKTVPSCQ